MHCSLTSVIVHIPSFLLTVYLAIMFDNNMELVLKFLDCLKLL